MKIKFNKQLIKIMIPCLLASAVIGLCSLIGYVILFSFVALFFAIMEEFNSTKIWGGLIFIIGIIPMFTVCVIPMMFPVFAKREKIEGIVGKEKMKRVIFSYGIKCEVLMVIIVIIFMYNFIQFVSVR